MTETTVESEGTKILVEFESMRRTGVRQVSRGPGEISERLAQKSARALDSAMGTIQSMAHRVTETVREIKVAERRTRSPSSSASSWMRRPVPTSPKPAPRPASRSR